MKQSSNVTRLSERGIFAGLPGPGPELQARDRAPRVRRRGVRTPGRRRFLTGTSKGPYL